MFGSTWGSNQQPNQQQTSAFGQPSAFGQSAFGGGTNAFGGQQQQPQANPMFGNLSASTSNNTGGGFGAFGNNNAAQTNAVNPMFGAAKPATGFGAFGGGNNNAFGSTSAFGQTNNAAPATGQGVFGQPANNNTTTSAFGQTPSLFGKPATTAFGAPANNNTNQMENVPAVTTGSSNPPYAVYSEKDPAQPTVTLNYQSISCMPAYRGTSFEELRLQDYAQGRKTAGAFGQSAAFGGVQQPTNSIFGQAQPAQQTSVFGAPQTQPTTGFGGFGSTAPAANAFGGNNAFGQPQQQQQQQQQTGAFGAFGQPQQPQQQTSVFGGGTTTGAFGGDANKPAFGGFGGGGAFGSTNNTNPLGGNTQQPAQTSIFGNNTTQPATTGFGGFGNNNNNAAKPSIFGQPAAQPTQNAFGSTNLFGQNQQQQAPAQQPSAFGGFGTNTQQQPANPNPLFGGTNTNTTTNSNPLFGGNSLFNNNNNQQQQQQQSSSLFGAKPAAPLFPSLGATNNNNTTTGQTGGGLFGNNTLGGQQQQNQTSAFGGSNIFGNNNANKPLGAPTLGQSNSTGLGQSTGGLFGGFNGTNTLNTSSSLMNNNNGGFQQQQQGTLTASIAQPIATDLFSMLPPGPHAVNLEQSTKKKVPFFVDVPTRSPIPRVGLSYTPAGSKLRGFGASASASTQAPPGSPGNPFAFASMSLTNGRPGVLSLSRAPGGGGGFDSPERSGSPALGSGPRHSVKKLILDKKVEAGELFAKSTSPGASPGRARITFSPALGIAAREKEQQAAAALARTNGARSVLDSPTPPPRAAAPPANRFTAQQQQGSAANGGAQGGEGDNAEEEGEYWVRPDLATLRQVGYEKLSAFPDLVVGRVGYGEIRFLEPVDLTGLPKLGALLGEVVRFDDKECSVYPDSDEVDKPPPGAGLNVRARLMLLRCWAVDKATREPIKDAAHPSAAKHLKRLKNMKDTHFESFDIGKGEWVFTVDHF